MALIPCRECGAQISSSAATCPHCGISLASRRPGLAVNRGCLGVVVIIMIVVVVAMNSNSRNDPALRSSTDPAEIARLVLNQPAANSSAAIDGDRFVMTYSLAPWSLTSGTVIIAFEEHVAELVPLIFQRFPKVNRIDINATGKFSDIRGSSFEQDAIRLMFTRRNAATIQWDEIDHGKIPKLADQYWIHPSMAN
jgi:hypothetical protein